VCHKIGDSASVCERYHHNIRSDRWRKQPGTDHGGWPLRDAMARNFRHSRIRHDRNSNVGLIGFDLVRIAPNRSSQESIESTSHLRFSPNRRDSRLQFCVILNTGVRKEDPCRIQSTRKLPAAPALGERVPLAFSWACFFHIRQRLKFIQLVECGRQSIRSFPPPQMKLVSL
jgi:hypothetical protein